MSDFAWLTDAARRWPQQGSSHRPEGVIRRLGDALSSLATAPSSVGPADLAGLVGHVLRRDGALHDGAPTLNIPAGSGWPGVPSWEAAGCHPVQLPGGRTIVSARPWNPSWLPGLAATTSMEAVLREELRRHPEHVRGDGFLGAVGRSDYLTPGQRQATRAVLGSRPGATILVNLPTGSGKSVVAHLPALLWTEAGGTAVVVVPTTALALDQERSFRAVLRQGGAEVGTPYAYHEGLAADERAAVREGLRCGTQRLVFTSPESLLGALAPALFTSAQAGRLRLLAVDEAHLVSQWGTEFRPEYQALAGTRRALLRATVESGAPAFRTLLMTATLTEEALATLHTLFADPGPFEHISAVTLRPEPSLWIRRCADEGERGARLREAVAHLPRPIIVFASTRAAVSTIATQLRVEGYGRIATVDGKTPAGERLRVLRSWRGETPEGGPAPTAVDIVVATSAFGLGVDLPDVRSVVHACIPETIDRYYQEIGRAGRDGRACISLLLWTEKDKRVARSLNSRRTISTDRGFERWGRMFGQRVAVDAQRGLFRVPLSAQPSDILVDSDENRAWNLRTLTLMCRAGLLSMDAVPPPRRSGDSEEPRSDEEVAAAFERYRAECVVAVQDPGAHEEASWVARCAASRQHVRAADAWQFRAMLSTLGPTPRLCAIFVKSYTIDWLAPGGTERVRVTPERSCGGCAACRADGSPSVEGCAPNPRPTRHPAGGVSADLARALQGASTLLAFVPDTIDLSEWRRKASRLVKALVPHGVRTIIGPPDVLEMRDVQDAYRLALDGGLFLVGLDELPFIRLTLPPVPTLCLLPIDDPTPVLPREVLETGTQAAQWIVTAPAGTLDPEHRGSLASTRRFPQTSVEYLLRL